MICYHSPRDIIGCYDFHVELLAQTPTSMHGSKEGHTGYIYRRTKLKSRSSTKIKSDPLYASALEVVEGGLDGLKEHVAVQMDEAMLGGTSTRSSRSQRSAK
jgi:hypothetical protein